MSRYVIVIVLLFLGEMSWAQVPDSTPPVPDTVRNRPPAPRPRNTRSLPAPAAAAIDSFLSPVKDSIPKVRDTAFGSDSFRFSRHPFFRFSDPVRLTISVRQWKGKEAIFYSLIGLLIFFALIRNGFPRYINELLQTFFRTSIKQRQIKDQLVQNPLPSLLLNIFFALSMGMFLALLLQYYGLGTEINFWLLFLYCVLGLAAIYAVKFITLKAVGWIFQVSEAVDTYIYIVFTTNKIIGIAILPFLVVLSFTSGTFKQVTLTLSILLVLGLLAYRFFLSFISIQRMVQISFFHFLLYLSAFEVAPLLLINKLLFTFLG